MYAIPSCEKGGRPGNGRPQLKKTERVNTMKKVIEDAFKKALEIAIEKKDPDSIACVASSYNSAIQFERQTSTAIKRSNS